MKFTYQLLSSTDETSKDEIKRICYCTEMFASDTAHIVVIHVTPVVNRVS